MATVRRSPANVKAAATELNATAASLLGFLMCGAQTGYELAADIDDSIGNFWNVTRSQIYRELRVLEQAGYVRVGKTGLRDRRPYTLTPAGRIAFDAWLERGPGPLVTRSPLLLTIFFADRLSKPALRRIVRRERAQHEERLETYRRRLPDVARVAPYPGLTMRYGEMYETMVLAWLDSIERDGFLADTAPESDSPHTTDNSH